MTNVTKQCIPGCDILISCPTFTHVGVLPCTAWGVTLISNRKTDLAVWAVDALERFRHRTLIQEVDHHYDNI